MKDAFFKGGAADGIKYPYQDIVKSINENNEVIYYRGYGGNDTGIKQVYKEKERGIFHFQRNIK